MTPIVGIILIAYCVVACLPCGLDWSEEIVDFLKGCSPVLAAFVGLICVFIGFADIKDKKEAKKEEEEAKRTSDAAKTQSKSQKPQ